MRAAVGAGARQTANQTRERRIVAAVAAGLLVTVLAAGLAWWWQRWSATTLPDVPVVDLSALFTDSTPVTVTFPAGGERVTWNTTADDVRRSVTLWRRMHLADWNRVPAALREEGLDNMLRRYHELLVYAGQMGCHDRSRLGLGPSAVVVLGLTTNVCVQSTARDAWQHDYRTITLDDCCAEIGEGSHAVSLAWTSRNFGLVSTSSEVCRRLRLAVR